MNNHFSQNFKKTIFLIPLILITNPVYADNAEIQMDWLIEGQINEQNISSKESELLSGYVQDENLKSTKSVYDKFITDNQYSFGDYKITIDSEEGQIIAGMLIEQRDLRQESFQQKIKYFDRFSDGYVEIAEALLDPIGDSKYLINGRSLDYNPNSNMELFVLERGYSMDNLEAIPNDIFTPREFTLGRAMMDEAIRSGEGEFDLRKYSPNYLELNKEQIQERMTNSFSEQTSQLFNEIISGKQLESDGTLSDNQIGLSQPSKSIFDNFKFEQSKFENTRHIRDSLQSDPFRTIQISPGFENISLLLLIPIFTALVIFGYLMNKKRTEKKLVVPLLQVSKPQIDFRELTHDMLNKSQSLYDNNKRKEAYEILSQAIRYYYSQRLGIYKEITNLELLIILKESKSNEYNQVKNRLLLCGSVEYARYTPDDDEFEKALSQFSKEISI